MRETRPLDRRPPIRGDTLRRARVPTACPMARDRLLREVRHAPSNPAPEARAPHASPVEPLHTREVAGSTQPRPSAESPARWRASSVLAVAGFAPGRRMEAFWKQALRPRVVHVPPGGLAVGRPPGLPSYLAHERSRRGSVK